MTADAFTWPEDPRITAPPSAPADKLAEGGRNPYLPEAPADGQHIFEGSYRCKRCGVYNNRAESNIEALDGPCLGKWAHSRKMRYAAEDRWKADLLARRSRADATLRTQLATAQAALASLAASVAEVIAYADRHDGRAPVGTLRAALAEVAG